MWTYRLMVTVICTKEIDFLKFKLFERVQIIKKYIKILKGDRKQKD